MLTMKSSITILAIAGSLTIGFAPQTSFAQSAGAATAGQAIKENIEKRDEQLAKLDREEAARQKNLAKNLVKPQPAAGSTGGTSGFTNPPPPAQPEGPSFAERCFGWVCTIVKVAVAPGAVIVEHVYNAINEPEDEAKRQKEHNDTVHRMVEEQRKAREAEKVEQKTPVAPNSTELKTVDLKKVETKTVETKKVETKNVETKNHVSLDVPTHQSSARLALLEAHEVKTPVAARATLTTVSHFEVSRPAANIARPAVNAPRATINTAHVAINLPTVRR